MAAGKHVEKSETGTRRYPYGDWNYAVRRSAENAGLQAVFTVDPGVARRGADAYVIPRIQILRQDTGWRFLWKIVKAS